MDDERLKNLIIFKAPLTDAEIEEAAPALVVILLVVILFIVGIVWVNKMTAKKDSSEKVLDVTEQSGTIGFDD